MLFKIKDFRDDKGLFAMQSSFFNSHVRIHFKVGMF